MTVVLLLLVAAAAAWVIWGMDRDAVGVAVRRNAKVFKDCGLSVASLSPQRLVFDVDCPELYAKCATKSLTTACRQVLGGPVDLADERGQVIVTKKK
mgnify:CR=1 FL=1